PGLVITSYQGREEAPTLDLALSEADIATYIATVEQGAEGVWPDVNLTEAAYRLFLVHVDEYVFTWNEPRLTIRLVGDRLKATAG
ncbi:MAG: hypothetical protein ACRDQZ_12175, partial [Mycobacteriales bacterium]